jgi:hypothetical protein
MCLLGWLETEVEVDQRIVRAGTVFSSCCWEVSTLTNTSDSLLHTYMLSTQLSFSSKGSFFLSSMILTRGITTSAFCFPLTVFHPGSQPLLTHWPKGACIAGPISFVVVSGFLFGVFLPILVTRIGWVVNWQEKKKSVLSWAKTVFMSFFSNAQNLSLWEASAGQTGSWLSPPSYLFSAPCLIINITFWITIIGKMKLFVWSEGTHFSLLSAHVNI